MRCICPTMWQGLLSTTRESILGFYSDVIVQIIFFQLQYRRLWELRATLEEDEELTDPCRVNKKSKQQKGQSKKLQTSSQKQKPVPREAKMVKKHSDVRPQNKSSSDQSPGKKRYHLREYGIFQDIHCLVIVWNIDCMLHSKIIYP